MKHIENDFANIRINKEFWCGLKCLKLFFLLKGNYVNKNTVKLYHRTCLRSDLTVHIILWWGFNVVCPAVPSKRYKHNIKYNYSLFTKKKICKRLVKLFLFKCQRCHRFAWFCNHSLVDRETKWTFTIFIFHIYFRKDFHSLRSLYNNRKGITNCIIFQCQRSSQHCVMYTRRALLIKQSRPDL